ncbi:hypothetical protein FGO68_gene1491 [Halteria grandinella]|uniref:Uncharacterized protein n=1 Tax=Halteria grandinella TaxID=5974 RepID=A0A8J8NQK4_HALGN|nr:hypothetical protein FGO68_gene1491 [Halteria grandinella]
MQILQRSSILTQPIIMIHFFIKQTKSETSARQQRKSIQAMKLKTMPPEILQNNRTCCLVGDFLTRSTSNEPEASPREVIASRILSVPQIEDIQCRVNCQ